MGAQVGAKLGVLEGLPAIVGNNACGQGFSNLKILGNDTQQSTSSWMCIWYCVLAEMKSIVTGVHRNVLWSRSDSLQGSH